MDGPCVEILVGGCSGAFSDLHGKTSERCVCNFAGLTQTSEIVCSPDVSANSMLVYSACGYCSSVTSKYVLALKHQVIYKTDIGKCLLTCIQIFSILQLYVCFISIEVSDIGKCLRSGAGCSPDRNRCMLSSVNSCAFYPSVSVGSSDEESMSTVFRLGSIENDVNLSVFLSLLESLRVHLEQNGLRAGNIGTDIFRYGADSAQYKSI